MNFIATIFTVLGTFLQAYNIYRQSDQEEKDKVNAIKEMGPLLEHLKFCKLVHGTFGEFKEKILSPFIAETKTVRDLDKIEPQWNTLKSFYRKEIHSKILRRVPPEIPKKKGINPEEYPSSIKDNVRVLSGLYPDFLHHLRSYGRIHQEIEDKLQKLDLGGFPQLKTRLEDLVGQIIDEADALILELLPILMFMYDEVFFGR